MMRKLSLLLAAVCMSVVAGAQYCGFDKVHTTLLSSSTAYAKHVHDMDSSLTAFMANNSNALIINTPNGPLYEIPVVIHVMKPGPVALPSIYNPSDATLQGMITYLNQAYQATYASYPSATGGGTYFPVQFTLAKRDQNCNATTTGIDRQDAVALLGGASSANGIAYSTYGIKHNGSNGVDERKLKTLVAWNSHDYYNIYVVNKIDGMDGTVGTFVAGYAYFPGAPGPLDGTIMLATQAVAGSTTLPHEIGHAFSLYHVFQGDDPANTGAATTCPSNANCATDGDMVCDTEPMKRSLFNCPTTNSCTGVAFTNATQHNFMDYSNCQDRFTPGQKTRWLNSMTVDRLSLLSSLGATPLGSTTTVAPNCTYSINNPFSQLDAGVYETKIIDPSLSAPYSTLMTATSEGGYYSDSNQVYIDRFCYQRATLTAGNSYTIKVLTGPSAERVRVYVDWNNDGVFNPGATPSELVYTHNGTVGYEVHTGTINVPSTGITTCIPIRIRVVSDVVTASFNPSYCGSLDEGQGEDYSLVIKSSPNSVVTVTQTTGSNPSCVGSTIGFTASYTGTPTSPAVKIYKNDTLVSSTNTYSGSTAIVNGDKITAKLFFTGTCGLDSITSSAFTVSRTTVVTPSASIAVTTGSNPGCAGQSITLTATPTNGGTGPTYKWYVNGTLASGTATAPTFSTTPACGSTIVAQLTSNSACATTSVANSNTITYTCGPQAISVTVAITAGSNPTCSGRNVTFAATPTNGGTTPTYQWYVKGIAISGATGATFTTNTLNNGDSVNVLLTSSSPCAATPTAFSPAIYMVVVPSVTPSVKLAITAGTNPGCIGDAITLTGNTTNAGATPTFRWYLNGNPIPFATLGSYTTATGVTGDKLWVRIIGANPSSSCYTRDSAWSDTITLDRRPVPSLPAISFIGHQLISDSTNVQWWGPAGLLPGATGPVYTPTVQGDYYAVIMNPLCGTGKSNVLTISPLSVGNYNMTGVRFFPNPTTGILTITWGAASTTRITVYTATGKALIQDAATNATHKALDLSALPAGAYFVQLQDEGGHSGTVSITVMH